MVWSTHPGAKSCPLTALYPIKFFLWLEPQPLGAASIATLSGQLPPSDCNTPLSSERKHPEASSQPYCLLSAPSSYRVCQLLHKRQILSQRPSQTVSDGVLNDLGHADHTRLQSLHLWSRVTALSAPKDGEVLAGWSEPDPGRKVITSNLRVSGSPAGAAATDSTWEGWGGWSQLLKENLKNFFNTAYKSVSFLLYQRHDLLSEEAILTK